MILPNILKRPTSKYGHEVLPNKRQMQKTKRAYFRLREDEKLLKLNITFDELVQANTTK
jgi:hypothetical protein